MCLLSPFILVSERRDIIIDRLALLEGVCWHSLLLESTLQMQAAGCELKDAEIVSLLERYHGKLKPPVSEHETEAAPPQAEPETPSGASSRHRYVLKLSYIIHLHALAVVDSFVLKTFVCCPPTRAL